MNPFSCYLSTPTAESLITAFLLSLFLEWRGGGKWSKFEVDKNVLVWWGIRHTLLLCRFGYLCGTQTELLSFHLQSLFAEFHCILGCTKCKEDSILPRSFESKCGKRILHIFLSPPPPPHNISHGKGKRNFGLSFLEIHGSLFISHPVAMGNTVSFGPGHGIRSLVMALIYNLCKTYLSHPKLNQCMGKPSNWL